MAYIITDPCVGTCDTACVEVCPVDCIHGPEDKEGAGAEAKEPGFDPVGKQLYIDPEECIDCGACEPECPVDAIMCDEDVPEDMNEFIEFLSYPNDANFKTDINKLITWTEDKFNSLDFRLEKLNTETFPLLLATKHINDDYKTILVYLHLDGQPIDLSKWNQEDPFNPVFKLKENGKFVNYEWNEAKDLKYGDLEKNDIRIFYESIHYIK